MNTDSDIRERPTIRIADVAQSVEYFVANEKVVGS